MFCKTNINSITCVKTAYKISFPIAKSGKPQSTDQGQKSDKPVVIKVLFIFRKSKVYLFKNKNLLTFLG